MRLFERDRLFTGRERNNTMINTIQTLLSMHISRFFFFFFLQKHLLMIWHESLRKRVRTDMLMIWKRTSRTWPGRDFGAKCDVPRKFCLVALKSVMKICIFSFMLMLYIYIYIYIVHVYTGVFSKKNALHTYVHTYMYIPHQEA